MSKVKNLFVICALLVVLVFSTNAFACTILMVGKDATVDGSAMITHNDDSTTADFRLWIIPERDWPAGSMREIVLDSHNYGDFGQYPDVKNYGGGVVLGEMPQAAHTYRYFHSRYSFMNEKGVAMGESTFSIDRSTEHGKAVYQVLMKDLEGIIDCWYAQDIALERAATAREAIQIMGDLVEEYGWNGPGETMDITDGNEAWVAEFYGAGLWCAVRIPSDHFFVAANRARICDVDLNDTENVMYSPDLVSFAVEKGWWSPNSGKPFSPAEIYAPNNDVYATRREWRAFDLVAPSLQLSPHALRFPLSVKPERQLSVDDIFKISGDYYQGTEYDLTQGPAAGPWGDPIRYANSDKNGGAWERSINMHRTCYLHIGQVKSWLPDPIKGVSWYGYGAPDSSYLTPLWPAMQELPPHFSIGSRFEEFRRDSGWWINTYVQQMAELRYSDAIKDIYAFREPKMNMLYQVVPQVQELAAQVYKTNPEAAIEIISNFAYMNAVAWHQEWTKLGDQLLGNYAMGYKNFKTTPYPSWWNETVEFKPLER